MKHKKNYTLKSVTAIIFMLALSLLNQGLKAQTIMGGPTCIYAGGVPPASYTLSPTTGLSHIQWSTAGDIVITDSSGASVTIKSQSTQPSSTRPDDGKGRLYVSYIVDSASECGPHLIYEDVYKYFDDSDNIVGPTCVKTGDTVTYSIKPVVSVNLDAEIGIDQYKWIIPSSWLPNIQYYSADSSSITFIVGTTTGHDSLKVGIGECNLNDGNYVDTLVLGLSIPTPILSFPSCLPAGAKTITVNWTNPPAIIDSFSWTYPSNWTKIDAMSSQDSITLAIDNNPGNVGLWVKNDCQMADTTITINRSLDSSSTISGNTCVIAGSVQTYTVTNAPVNTPLQWTLPVGNGWSFASSGNAGQTVSVNIGTDTGTIYVTGVNCSSVVDSIEIKLKPANPTTLTGTDTLALCNTDSLTYTVNTVVGANNGYGWMFPTGWSPATTTTTGTSVNVKPDGKTSGQVQVFAYGGCQNSDTLTLNVTYDTLMPPTIIRSKDCGNVGLNDTIRYSISPVDTTLTYGWVLPAGSGWTIDSTNTDSSVIRVITTGIAGSFTIQAFAKNSCGGISAYTTNTLNVVGLVYTITADFNPHTVEPHTSINDAPAYQWYANGIAVPDDDISYGNTNYPIINPVSFPLCVNVTSDEGCITRQCIDTFTSGLSMRIAAGETQASIASTNSNASNMKVSPNPAHSILNVQFNDASNRHILLLDAQGKIVLSEYVQSQNTTINVANVTAGIYYLTAHWQNGSAVASIVISR